MQRIVYEQREDGILMSKLVVKFVLGIGLLIIHHVDGNEASSKSSYVFFSWVERPSCVHPYETRGKIGVLYF
jgi:hypothetical protein